MTRPINENAFEQVCQLASSERWCWKIPCTTCGNHNFRFSFREISRGKQPKDSDWVIHNNVRDLPRKLGPLGYPRDTPFRDKVAVLRICAEADLRSVGNNCAFPDWLGYLGLILHFMRCDDDAYVDVSLSWSRQLRDMVDRDSPIWAKLDASSSLPDRLLRFEDLECVESAMYEHSRHEMLLTTSYRPPG